MEVCSFNSWNGKTKRFDLAARNFQVYHFGALKLEVDIGSFIDR